MDIGSPWQWFVRDSQQNLPDFQPHIWIDLVLAVLAGMILFLGVQFSDMAARSAWLTWAPPNVDWNGIKRGDEKREPLLRPVMIWWHNLIAVKLKKAEGERCLTFSRVEWVDDSVWRIWYRYRCNYFFYWA